MATAIFFTVTVGHIGFSPMDEGVVLGQSWRLLHGEIPHAEMASVRPLGSAFLHVVDFAVPLPLMVASRLVAAGQVALYSTLLARFALGRPVGEWGPFAVLATAGSIFVNLHVFPLMAWHTVDGIMLVAIGLNVLEAGQRRQRIGVVCLGTACMAGAALVKQSFWPALALTAAWLLWRSLAVPAGRRRVRELGLPLVAGLTPLLAYVGMVALGGGVGAMVAQVGGGNEGAVYGQHLWQVLLEQGPRNNVLAAVVAAAFALVLLEVIREPSDRQWASKRRAPSPVVAVSGTVVAAAVTIGLLWIPANERFSGVSFWGAALTWTLVALVTVRRVLFEVVDWRAALVVVVAWMAMLSRGYPTPTLVAGTVLLTILERLWREVDLGGRHVASLRQGLLVGATIAFAATAGAVLDARRDAPYWDRPAGQLTYRLSRAGSEFGNVHTNPVTGAYVKDVSDCIRRYPTRWVAVIPDFAGAYVLLGVRNPFPVDWLVPGETAGAESKVSEAADRLDREGNYLVLLAPVSPLALPELEEPPPPIPEAVDSLHGTVGLNVARRLSGRPVACGMFAGFYKPGIGG